MTTNFNNFATLVRKDGSKVYMYEVQTKWRNFLYKRIGNWQYNPYGSFRHYFAFVYLTGPYVLPFIPLFRALKAKKI